MIVLMVRSPYDLDKQLKILKNFCSSKGIIVNIGKTKVVIIKSQKITYDNFMYENNNLEEVTSCKYLESIFNTSLTETIALRKRLMEDRKIIMGLKILVN